MLCVLSVSYTHLDEKTAEYCDIELNEFQKSLTGDEDATYMKTITYRAEDFVPVMACPSQVDKIKNCLLYTSRCV